MKRTNHRRVTAAATPRTGKEPSANGASTSPADAFRLKVGLAEMLKGGVIMDVMNAEQAEIAQEAGAAAVANAVHHATGIRVRDLPLRLDRLVVA